VPTATEVKPQGTLTILDFKKHKQTNDFQLYCYKSYFINVDEECLIHLKIALGFDVFIEKKILLGNDFAYLIRDFPENRLTKIQSRIKELLEPITQVEYLFLTMDKSYQVFSQLYYKPNTNKNDWHCVNDTLIDEINKGIL
jgi:hypothetical protein